MASPEAAVAMDFDEFLAWIDRAIDRRLERIGFGGEAPMRPDTVGRGDAPRVVEIAEPVAAYDAVWRREAARGRAPGDLSSDAVPEDAVLEDAVPGVPAWELLSAPPPVAAGDHPSSLPSTLPEIVAASDTALEAADRLGVNGSRVRQRLGAGTLYGFKHEGAWRLPRWQFEAGASIPRLDRVMEALDPDVSPVAVSRWFTSAWQDLVDGERLLSPRRWLLEGRDPAPVVAQARML
ncbi:MAG: hypothetical protein AAGC60_17320 [Acidobacteriota bacterium]